MYQLNEYRLHTIHWILRGIEKQAFTTQEFINNAVFKPNFLHAASLLCVPFFEEYFMIHLVSEFDEAVYSSELFLNIGYIFPMFYFTYC